MTPSPETLLEQARIREEETLAFLRDLVRIPSVNGRDSEKNVAQRVLKEAERLGLQGQLVGPDADRPNVLIGVGNGSRGFALIGHMDTVAEGDPAIWTYPPFGAKVTGGRVYGRGTADNKAGIACGLYTLMLLKDKEWFDPASTRVTLAGVVDEESGASSPLGIRYLLDEGLIDVEAAIYTYASDIICIGHRGLLRLVLHAQGVAIHSGSPEWSRGEGGVNAVTGLAAILLKLETLDLIAPPHPAFEGLGAKLTPGTLIAGGDAEGMVPAWARASVDIRLMPGQSAREVISIIEDVIGSEVVQRPGLSVSLEETINLPGVAIPADHRLVELARHFTRVITGTEWSAEAAGPANEGYMLINAGIPTLCGFGPTGDNAHAPDEYIEISSMVPTVAMYAGIIQAYFHNNQERARHD